MNGIRIREEVDWEKPSAVIRGSLGEKTSDTQPPVRNCQERPKHLPCKRLSRAVLLLMQGPSSAFPTGRSVGLTRCMLSTCLVRIESSPVRRLWQIAKKFLIEDACCLYLRMQPVDQDVGWSYPPTRRCQPGISCHATR